MQELVEELGIYMLFFGRAGYGDNDAHGPPEAWPQERHATDVEELTDALQLGDRFYVVGCSMGG
jgi:pimeloyl-ACP methyl ester carboxylesterase